MKLNWFEQKTLENLCPYSYNDNLSNIENAKINFIDSQYTLITIPIMLIGLISLKQKYNRGKKENDFY